MENVPAPQSEQLVADEFLEKDPGGQSEQLEAFAVE
jgi:hypothetical protein